MTNNSTIPQIIANTKTQKGSSTAKYYGQHFPLTMFCCNLKSAAVHFTTCFASWGNILLKESSCSLKAGFNYHNSKHKWPTQNQQDIKNKYLLFRKSLNKRCYLTAPKYCTGVLYFMLALTS